jgi:hypothetical protein
MRSVLDEVVGPDVIGTFGAQPHTRPIVQPEPTAFRLLLGDLQPLPSPDSLNPLGIHLPACLAQQRRDPTVAVTAIGRGQGGDGRRRSGLIITALGALRWLERCSRSTAQARRSDTFNSARTLSMHARRREGLRSFPGPPPTG